LWHALCSLDKQNHCERRKNMKKVSLTILTALLIMAVATLAFGYGRGRDQGGKGHGFGRGPCAMEGRSAADLKLTADQETAIRSLREAHVKETKPLRDKMFSKNGDLRLLWREKTPDQNKIAATQKEIRNLRDQMQDKGTANRLALLKVLTPEQQSKIQTHGGRGFGQGAGRGQGQRGGGPGCEGGPGCGPRGNW
jgi:Spy/CpxP family protein refolding chaperone